jgi:hypothetical protein
VVSPPACSTSPPVLFSSDMPRHFFAYWIDDGTSSVL